MKRLFLLISCFCTLNCLLSQNIQRADQLFSDKRYSEAARMYSQLLARSPKNALFNYRYARCLYEQGKNMEAIRYFQKAGNKYPLTSFYLGEAYFREYFFDEALSNFSDYLASVDEQNVNYGFVERRINQCHVGSRFIRHVQNIAVIDTQMVAAADFLKVYRMSADAGKVAINSGLAVYTNSRDNRRIITQRGETGRAELYSSERIMDGWTDAVAFYSSDDSDVNFPFLLSDGVTLFFSSDSDDGMGGWDIYTTRYNTSNENFYKAENLGFPFNSPFNDYMLAVDESAKQGWFATDRYCPSDSVKIVSFVWNDGEKKYYSSEDSTARSFAQLKNIVLTEREESDFAVVSPVRVERYSASAETNKGQSFQFVAAEGVIYENYSDFRNADAREMYRAYRTAYELYEKDLQSLDKLRLQYSVASQENRLALAEEIQSLEASTEKQLNALKQKENQIRQLEQIQL